MRLRSAARALYIDLESEEFLDIRNREGWLLTGSVVACRACEVLDGASGLMGVLRGAGDNGRLNLPPWHGVWGGRR